jgi:aromatic amino acid aminotransferase I
MWFWSTYGFRDFAQLALQGLYQMVARSTFTTSVTHKVFNCNTGLRTQYSLRRDQLLDCFFEAFHVELSENNRSFTDDGARFLAFKKRSWSNRQMTEKSDRKVLLSFIPPTSGMFVWVRLVHLLYSAHRTDWQQVKINFPAHKAYGDEPEESLEMQFFVKLLQRNVLFAPGTFFSAEHMEEKSEGHLRISFSDATVCECSEILYVKLTCQSAGDYAEGNQHPCRSH